MNPISDTQVPTPAQAAAIQAVVSDALDKIHLEAALEDKLVKFQAFLESISGGGLSTTPFAHLTGASPKQVFVFMVLLFNVVTKNGRDSVTLDLIRRSISDTCMEYAKKGPLELMGADDFDKLERYVLYFAKAIELKSKTV